MKSEFEKNRYWIGLFKTDVEFNGLLGQFGRYELNGSRDVDHRDLEDFNSKWEAYAKAWQHQQSKIDELRKISVDLNTETIRQREQVAYYLSKNAELKKRLDAPLKLIPSLKSENDLWGCEQVELQIELLEQALKGGCDEAK